MSVRDVLEVDVPLLSRHGTTDAYIDSITARLGTEPFYLQTSPEFFMKRLLCAGSGDIYSLGKAFRNGEQGGRHNPEFTMLEWYRLGLNEQQLMDEVEVLLCLCLPVSSVKRISYREIFQSHLGFDPHQASVAELKAVAQQFIDLQWDDSDRDVWLDLLMTHAIEPKMGEGLVFVYDYPASQAALAKVQSDDRGQLVAKRFEAYFGGIELVNGYWELCDADEQQRRFEADNRKREGLGLAVVKADSHLLSALESGMPDCAGVALGIDRLLMLRSGQTDIRKVLTFAAERV